MRVLLSLFCIAYVSGRLLYLSDDDVSWDAKEIEKKKPHPNITSFDYFMLTRIYPTAVCRADDDTVPDSCEIPSGSSKWTLHGLWPNYYNGSYPADCRGDPQTFNRTMIEGILDKLRINWPNLYPKHSEQSLWKHEWEKHGVCAQSLIATKTELDYFSIALELNEKFDIEKALSSKNIVPREKPYSIEQIQSALNDALGEGRHVQFNCLRDKVTKELLFSDVRMCMNKGFEPIKCPSHNLITDRPSAIPLPSFQPCKKSVIFIPSTLIRKNYNNLIPPSLSIPLNYVNPLISELPTVLSNHTWMLVFLIVVMAIDYHFLHYIFRANT